MIVLTTKVMGPNRMGGGVSETPMVLVTDRIDYFEEVGPEADEHIRDATVLKVFFSSGFNVCVKETEESFIGKMFAVTVERRGAGS